MELLLTRSLSVITMGMSFLPAPSFSFSSRLPLLAELISPVLPYLPPNLLVKPGFSALVTLTSRL